jgi:inorganic triphosphatase YgiF
MSRDREVELKFLCAPEHLGAVLAAAPAGDDESHELISVYFDTQDRRLEKVGVSLRVRESKGRRVQTLKRGEGLSREEFEATIPSDRPDPALGPLKTLLCEGDQLRPAFNVRVTRRQRLIRLGEAQIELALDQGEVSGGRRSSPISEVELELKSGAPRALFDLARILSRAAPLYISFDGKASRGQALVADAPLQARRRLPVNLTRHSTVAEAFQANARDALGQIAANAVVLREAPDAEAVHQLRVAARRLRSALSAFRSVLADEGFETVRAELKWLAGATDRARNLDVFAEEVAAAARGLDPPPAALPALSEAVETARLGARAEVAQAVSSERFRALMLETTAWIETGSWLTASPKAGASARTFARKALARRRGKLAEKGRDLAGADDAARHRLRIEAKKLRYAAEGFRSLLPARGAKRFLEPLKALQEELGALNDIATAEDLIATLALSQPAAFAAGELAGLRAAGRPRRIDRAARAYDRLLKAPTPFG